VPPRFAYWTILVDNGPTAFRAAAREDLLPTVRQLQRTDRDVVLKWFERGRLWDSPETAREARRTPRAAEKRDRDWRPGGTHKDPKARFARGRSAGGKRPRRPADRKRPGPRRGGR
jgi:hypothetical protein